MKNLNKYLNESLITEGVVNKIELNTIIIVLGIYLNYRDMLKPKAIKFIDELGGEEWAKDVVDTLSYWDDNNIRKSYNALYTLYGDKMIQLCEYGITQANSNADIKSWEKIKSELENCKK